MVVVVYNCTSQILVSFPYPVVVTKYWVGFKYGIPRHLVWHSLACLRPPYCLPIYHAEFKNWTCVTPYISGEIELTLKESCAIND